MRILTLAVVSSLMLSTACKQMDDEAANVSALPQVEVPELSEQTMKDVTKVLSLDSYEGRAPGSAGEEKILSKMEVSLCSATAMASKTSGLPPKALAKGA